MKPLCRLVQTENDKILIVFISEIYLSIFREKLQTKLGPNGLTSYTSVLNPAEVT